MSTLSQYVNTPLEFIVNNGKIDVTNPKNWFPFAAMCQNAYLREQDSFLNISGYAAEESFGWDAPFIRGYVFFDAVFQHVIIAIKETSVTGPFNTPDIISTNSNDAREVCCNRYVVNERITCCSLVVQEDLSRLLII